MKRTFIMLLALTLPAGADEQARMSRLMDGEIVMSSAHDASGGAARVAALLHAPAERVWNTLLSCEQARVYVPEMTHCEVLEFDGERGKINHVIDQPWPFPALDIVFESHYEPYDTITSTLLTGTLSDFRAEWRFQARGQAVLVEYTVHIEPAYPVPGFLVRHYIRKQLPDMIACLRALADGSGSPAQHHKDRSRCRGDAR